VQFKLKFARVASTPRLIEQDGIQVKIAVVRPKGATGVLPVFTFFHGGGWILGDYAGADGRQ